MVRTLCIVDYQRDYHGFQSIKEEGNLLIPVLLVSAGGVIGSLFRYFLGVILPSNAQGNLVANIIASAFAAHILVLMERRGLTALRYFLLPGFCGGLGTFSAITFEAVAPGEGGFIYLFLNLVLSFAAVAISLPLSRKWIPQR